ncbi:hypothetical protein R1flu_012592 [Riccia fluitans]|uniref:E2F/DP family winged-helix DNA-binding domain-containing protein n=1 Tax=Riccia fluitans TaxID=41844 RepID=A0ABD1ZC30_9MARC
MTGVERRRIYDIVNVLESMEASNFIAAVSASPFCSLPDPVIFWTRPRQLPRILRALLYKTCIQQSPGLK